MANVELTHEENEILEKLRKTIRKDIRDYEYKASMYGGWYKALAITAFILPLLVPIVPLIPIHKETAWITSLLAVFASIILGVSARLKLHENWITFGTIAFNLSTELYKFETSSEEYARLNDREALNVLMSKVRSIRISQFEFWKETAYELAELEKESRLNKTDTNGGE